MAIIIDPDDLDRWQVLVDPIAPTIDLKALGTTRGTYKQDGVTNGTTTFTSATYAFTTSGVVAGDIVTIGSGNNIKRYVVASVTNETTLVLVNAATGSETALTFRINDDVPLTPPSSVKDGVTLQCVYSFLKEEWRTLEVTGMPNLIQFVFPLESITREQFEIGGGIAHGDWDWANDDTRNLIRTGGWMHKHTDGLRKSDYPGIITLGYLLSTAQAYFQQTSATTAPVNFVLTGAVNQSIQTYGDATHGNFDRTGYLKLFCRKRGYTYAQSTIADIGVTALETIVNRFPLSHAVDPAIVKTDGEIQGTTPFQTVGTAIDSGADGVTLDLDPPGDGTIGKFTSITGAFATDLVVGDVLRITTGATQGYFEVVEVTSATEIHVDTSTSGTWGAGESALAWEVYTRVRASSVADGSVITDYFTAVNLTFGTGTGVLTRAAGSWITDGYVAQGYVTVNGSVSNNGTYLILSVDSATQLTCLATFTAEGPISCTHSNDIQGVLTSATSDFVTKGVVAGDMVFVTAATTAAYKGCYKVITRDNLTTLTVNTVDRPWPATAEAAVTFHVLKPGMHFQYLNTACTPGTGVSLTFASTGKTITRSAGNWKADGFRQGAALTITSGSTTNLKTFVIKSINSAVQVTVLETVANEGPISCNFTGFYGFKRQFSTTGDFFPFNWRSFGNGGTLAEIFQFAQRQLRNRPMGARTGDIDDASTTARGDITDLLMTFASPTGVTLNDFQDNLAAADYNNATYRDATSTNRNFPFFSSITINISTTLIDDAQTKINVFWTDTPNQFGTAAAVLVQDKDGVNMESLDPSSSPISFTYNYDATQNGHGGGDENITIVGIGAGTAQYVLATGQITQKNENVFSLIAATERNYSNP